jgi:signal transduction histidine kinase
MKKAENELPISEHKLCGRVKDPEHQGSMELGASAGIKSPHPGSEHGRELERMDHLSYVLKSVRIIHQATSSETDRERLVRDICDGLVRHRGYLSAIILLLGNNGEMPLIASAGIDEALISTLQGQINSGKMPYCIGIASAEEDPIVVEGMAAECEGCPIKRVFVNRREFIVRLNIGERTFGVLAVSIPAQLTSDELERSLFHAVGVEIALALGYFETEELKKKAEQLLKEQKHLEELVEKRTSELRGSNEELQHFAYVASHDLQEPLRMISSFLQLLSSRYSGKLDKDADEFIKYAVDGAVHLQNMIDDLLAISRVDSRGKEFTDVEMKNVIEDVLDNLAVLIDDEKVNISVGDMPTIKADRSQMTQLTQNLVENAIKFRGKDTPRIEISAKRGKGEWIFSIRDNGIGIDSKYFERIFVVFQRLHAGDAYKGTGIGLSIAKKVVERHKGRIWLESEVGKGSIFYFTIPYVKGS